MGRRSDPSAVGITLDSGGWIEVDVLLDALSRHGRPINRGALERLARENDKKRFACSSADVAISVVTAMELRSSSRKETVHPKRILPSRPPELQKAKAARRSCPGLVLAAEQVYTRSRSTMTDDAAIEVVREFWRRMATNDFQSVSAVLSPEFVLEWPQSKERIRGAERFARMNNEYPANGRWSFTTNRLFGNEVEVVSDVTVTDGAQVARAISFFTVSRGKITRLVEFWPEPFAAPANRAHLVEAME